MNKLTIIGHLTRDPELRVTPSGVSVCSFTVAVKRKVPKNGEKPTDYFRVNAWRQVADACSRFLTKGSKVAVVGELQAGLYESNGKTRMNLDVNAEEVEFLSTKTEREAPENPEREAPENPNDGFVTLTGDDIPF